MIINRINFDLQLINLLNFGAFKTILKKKETLKYSFTAHNFMAKTFNLEVCNFETNFDSEISWHVLSYLPIKLLTNALLNRITEWCVRVCSIDNPRYCCQSIWWKWSSTGQNSCKIKFEMIKWLLLISSIKIYVLWSYAFLILITSLKDNEVMGHRQSFCCIAPVLSNWYSLFPISTMPIQLWAK